MSLATDKLALEQLFDSCGGAAWTNSANWKTDDVSQWFGVTVEGDRVVKLILPNNNLTGEIPVVIEEMNALKILDLKDNQLTGKIPERIGDLKELTKLDLGSNQIEGDVPKSVEEMKKLEVLSVRDNNLEGFKADPGKLSSARVIAISGNDQMEIPVNVEKQLEVAKDHGVDVQADGVKTQAE